MDFILNNIIVLIPVAIVLAIRIAGAIKKRQSGEAEPQPERQYVEIDEDYYAGPLSWIGEEG